MKLRSPARFQQLISAFAAVALTATALGQGLPANIKLRGQPVQQGGILGVTPSGVEVQIGGGKLTFPLGNIESVAVAPPAELGAAYAALNARDIDKALGFTSAVVDKYKGLPVDWMQNACGLLVDLYLSKGITAKAKSAFADLQRLYPNASGPLLEVGAARIAFAEGDKNGAREKVFPIAEQALKEKNVPPVLARAYSQAFLVMGQLEEAEGKEAEDAKDLPKARAKYSEALENYLRTVTLFWHDPAAAAQAQEKADAIRKKAVKEKITVP